MTFEHPDLKALKAALQSQAKTTTNNDRAESCAEEEADLAQLELIYVWDDNAVCN